MEKTALKRQFILDGENHILLENHFHVNKLMKNYDNHLKTISKGGKEAKKYVSRNYIAKWT